MTVNDRSLRDCASKISASFFECVLIHWIVRPEW